LGYFTLTLYPLVFGETVSKGTIKKVDGFSRDVRAVGVVLIGQFGKDKELATSVSGKHLLDICLEVVYKIQGLAGGRAVILECHDIPPVVKFYEDNGFVRLQRDERDKYLQMARLL